MTALNLLTEPEVAQMLQISPRSLRAARADGNLSYLRIGRLIRYRDEDVRQFLIDARKKALATNLPSTPRTRTIRTFSQRQAAL